jgi:large subunit ribosomal protein L13
MKTYSAKPGEITRDWYLVDAEGKTLGRIATQIADRLRGKGKTVFTPHVDTGDFVVVINAEKIAVTGKKLEQKIYYKHSGYPGGLRERIRTRPRNRLPSRCKWRLLLSISAPASARPRSRA